MATYQAVKIVTLPAQGNLSGRLNQAVTINSDGRITPADAVTEVIVGTIAEKPSAVTDSPVAVALISGGGVIPMVAQAAITQGHIIVGTTTDGKVAGVAAVSNLAANQMGYGFALEAATAADQVIEVLAMQIAGS